MSRDELQERRWVRDAVKRNGEAMERSTFVLSIFTGNYNKDPIAVLQFGLAVCLDKPIVLLVPNGVEIPENVRKVATAIEFYVAGDRKSMEDATARLMEIAKGKTDAPRA